MSAHPFLPEVDQPCVPPGREPAAAATVVIDGNAKAPDLLAVALIRLQRLADHLGMVACIAKPADSDAVALAAFVQPQLDEACNLLRAAEHGLAGRNNGRA